MNAYSLTHFFFPFMYFIYMLESCAIYKGFIQNFWPTCFLHTIQLKMYWEPNFKTPKEKKIKATTLYTNMYSHLYMEYWLRFKHQIKREKYIHTYIFTHVLGMNNIEKKKGTKRTQQEHWSYFLWLQHTYVPKSIHWVMFYMTHSQFDSWIYPAWSIDYFFLLKHY